MINYWWVSRPKRKLNSVPSVLATFVETSLNVEWQGQRDIHLLFEEALERDELKRHGLRRDQGGSGARTYAAWLKSLGLIFTQESTKKVRLTLAGEAIINGDNPVTVLKNQIFKYQFPSSFSISRGVHVADRFVIRPFLFLVRLLADPKIGFLTTEEIAKIVITEAENESEACFIHIVKRILEFRESSDECLSDDFFEKYQPSRGKISEDHPFERLLDVSNTIINWLEYTQLIERDSGIIRIFDDKTEEVQELLDSPPPFIDRPEDHEYFQRKYGVDPKHQKDTRNLEGTRTITSQVIIEQQLRRAFIEEALVSPITKITSSLVDRISNRTGVEARVVEETLLRLYPHGAIGGFFASYFDMAFGGKKKANDFEKATATLFQDVLGYQSMHVGPLGKTPDVLIISHEANYQAIIDNKAYRAYSITNDHFNRMVHNYVPALSDYSDSLSPLAFFLFIAGGFSNSFEAQLAHMVRETKINGAGLSVSRLISLIEKHSHSPYTHHALLRIFSCNRSVTLSDL